MLRKKFLLSNYSKICQYDIFSPIIFFLSYTINRQIGVDMNEIIPIHHKIYTLSEEEYRSLRSQFVTLEAERVKHRKYMPYTFLEIFTILDTLVNDTKKTDEKVMGFIK